MSQFTREQCTMEKLDGIVVDCHTAYHVDMKLYTATGVSSRRKRSRGVIIYDKKISHDRLTRLDSHSSLRARTTVWNGLSFGYEIYFFSFLFSHYHSFWPHFWFFFFIPRTKVEWESTISFHFRQRNEKENEAKNGQLDYFCPIIWQFWLY